MKITFKDCDIPLTRDNLIKISEEIGARFYAKTIQSIIHKHSWDKKYDEVKKRVEPVEVRKIKDGHIVIRDHSFDYTDEEVYEAEGFTKKTVIVGLCPIEFEVDEHEWRVGF